MFIHSRAELGTTLYVFEYKKYPTRRRPLKKMTANPLPNTIHTLWIPISLMAQAVIQSPLKLKLEENHEIFPPKQHQQLIVPWLGHQMSRNKS